MNVRFKTVQEFVRSAGSRDDFFKSGVMMACRCETSNCPPDSDALHMCVRYGRSTSRTSLRMNVGTGSSEHDFVGKP